MSTSQKLANVIFNNFLIQCIYTHLAIHHYETVCYMIYAHNLNLINTYKELYISAII